MLQTKAESLAIHIVAEIDLPGHSTALLQKLPSLAAVSTATGKPCSLINVTSPVALATLTTLLDEVMDLFPTSPWHHLGADEVSFDSACGMTKQTYHGFINAMNKFIRSRNKTTVVWGGFDPSPGTSAPVIDKTVVVSPFDSIRLLPWAHRPHNCALQEFEPACPGRMIC